MSRPWGQQQGRTGRARRVVNSVLAVVVAVAGAAMAPTAVGAADGDPRGGSPALPQFDMNGDGKADIFWYAPGDDPDILWRSSGSDYARTSFGIDGEYAPLTGDFNGDNRSDVLFYAPGSASDGLWTSTGSGFSKRSFEIDGTYVPVVGDFDGDGRSDIFWYGPGSASDALWTSTGSGFSGRSFSVGGHYRPFAGDFDGDGRSELFWYAPGDAPDRIWNIDGATVTAEQFDVDGTYRPVPGDFDGDGATDIFWYGPGGRSDALWMSAGDGRNFTGSSHRVNGNYVPLSGDYDGDGESDILWYAPGTAGDVLWTARGDGTFSGAPRTINGEYHPVGLNSVGEAPLRLAPARQGDSGAHVQLLQQRLRDLNYFVPRTNGVYDSITAQAVMAFQKYHGLGRDGVAGSQTIARLESASPARMREGGNHVEVDLSRQLLMVNRNGRILVFNTSTGAPGWDTPPGRFTVNRQINGMRHAPLGQLWRPKYFNGGIAMHGSSSIPGYPASHGCTRLHNEAINYIWDSGIVPLGTPVWVYF